MTPCIAEGADCTSAKACVSERENDKIPFLDSHVTRAEVDSSRLAGQRPDIESDAMVGQSADLVPPIPLAGRDPGYRTR